MPIKISVLSSGQILLDGAPAQLPEVRTALQKADNKTDLVLYYRENPQAEPPPEVKDVMNLIIACKLSVKLSSKPDFSDCPAEPPPLRPPVPAALPEPAMPTIDQRQRAEEVFEAARRKAAGALVIVKPDRTCFVLPLPPASGKLPDFLPLDRACDIAAISDTSFASAKRPSIQDAARYIPFFGYLIGFCQAGHRVVIFEGHPSALAAGLAGSEFLILDSGMLPFLQPDWMAVAHRVMQPGGKVFLHQRENFQLLPLAASNQPPGWCLTEPDGEASYANCLLTTLAKGTPPQGTPESIVLETGLPAPDLAPLTTDPEELAWIATLPFRYCSLDVEKVMDVILNLAAKGKVDPSQEEWLLSVKLVVKGEPPRIQRFNLRRERTPRGLSLRITKL